MVRSSLSSVQRLPNFLSPLNFLPLLAPVFFAGVLYSIELRYTCCSIKLLITLIHYSYDVNRFFKGIFPIIWYLYKIANLAREHIPAAVKSYIPVAEQSYLLLHRAICLLLYGGTCCGVRLSDAIFFPHGCHPATWATSYRSTLYISSLEDLDHQVGIDDLSMICSRCVGWVRQWGKEPLIEKPGKR